MQLATEIIKHWNSAVWFSHLHYFSDPLVFSIAIFCVITNSSYLLCLRTILENRLLKNFILKRLKQKNKTITCYNRIWGRMCFMSICDCSLFSYSTYCIPEVMHFWDLKGMEGTFFQVNFEIYCVTMNSWMT